MANVFGKSPGEYSHIRARENQRPGTIVEIRTDDNVNEYSVSFPSSRSAVPSFVSQNRLAIQRAIQAEIDQIVHDEFKVDDIVPITYFEPDSDDQYDYSVITYPGQVENPDESVRDIESETINIVYTYDTIWDAVFETGVIDNGAIRRAARNAIQDLYDVAVNGTTDNDGLIELDAATPPMDNTTPTDVVLLQREIDSDETDKFIEYVQDIFGESLTDIKLNILAPKGINPDLRSFISAWNMVSNSPAKTVTVEELDNAGNDDHDRVIILVNHSRVVEFPIAQLPKATVTIPENSQRVNVEILYKYTDLVVKQPSGITYIDNPNLASSSTGESESDDIADDSVDTDQLADDAVGLDQIDAGDGTANQILARNADNDGLDWVDQSSGTGDITEVTTADDSGLTGGGTTGTIALSIADNGVTTARIVDDAVTNDKLADDSVGLAEINTSSDGSADQVLSRTASGLEWIDQSADGGSSAGATVYFATANANANGDVYEYDAPDGYPDDGFAYGDLVLFSIASKGSGIGTISVQFDSHQYVLHEGGTTTISHADIGQDTTYLGSVRTTWTADNDGVIQLIGPVEGGGGGDITGVAEGTGIRIDNPNSATPEVNVADAGVDTAQLADDAVNEHKIEDNAVKATHIAQGAVGQSEIASGAVHEDELADDAVTDAKIADVAASKITGTLVDGQIPSAIARLDDPDLTGTPTAPTAAANTNNTQIATTEYADAAAAAIVDSAPGTLNTLNELAEALGDDENYATTITNALGLKANIASPTFTGTPMATSPASGDDGTRIATTEWVQDEIADLGAGENIFADEVSATPPSGLTGSNIWLSDITVPSDVDWILLNVETAQTFEKNRLLVVDISTNMGRS